MPKKFDLDKITADYFSNINLGEMVCFFEKVAKKCPQRANEAVDKYIDFLQQSWIKKGKPEQDRKFFADMAYANIGWFVGYYDGQTQDLVLKTFDRANHPIYCKNTPMTFEQVKQATAKALRKSRAKSK